MENNLRKSTQKYILGFVVFLITFCILIILNSCNRKVQIDVIYCTHEGKNAYGLTNLYFDNGNGLNEKCSVYTEVKDNIASYSFYPKGNIKKIRILSNRLPEQKVYIQSIRVYVDGGFVGEVNKNIGNSIIPEESTVSMVHQSDCVKVEPQENVEWEFATYNENLVNLTNRITIGTLMRSIFYLGLLWGPCLCCSIGNTYFNNKKCLLYTKKWTRYVFPVSFFILCMVQKQADFFWKFFFAFSPFLFYHKMLKVKKMFWLIVDFTTLTLSQILLVYSYEVILELLKDDSYKWTIDYLWIVGLIWIGSMSVLDLLCRTKKNDSKIKLDKNTGDYIRIFFLLICTGAILYELMKGCLLEKNTFIQPHIFLIDRIITPVYMMNLMWLMLLWMAVYGLCGFGLSNLFIGIIYITILIGNGIKLKFHDTFLTPLDFFQIKEMLMISKNVLSNRALGVIVGVILFFSVFVILKRKKILKILCPKIDYVYLVLMGILCVFYTKMVLNGAFVERNIFYKGYENEVINERDDGFIFYNIINIANIHDLFMEEPTDYSKENVDKLKKTFPAYTDKISKKASPNVILIMAESLFDIEQLDHVSFNTEIEPTLKKYSKGCLISPRYGGYTAAVEYEALTGLSLSFFSNSAMPYTTYFNQKGKIIPSIAWEFKNNGYLTTAVHPNDKTFYNRDRAYSMLGFDKFIDKSQFTYTDQNTVAKFFLKDMPVAKKITELIETSDMPTFTFAVTIAGHYMVDDRYAKTDIEAFSDVLDNVSLHELEQAASAYRETDEMFQYLINYMKNSKEPTLLYIFGDHLPPLPALGKLNYLEYPINKYGTVLAAYGNYKNIELPEYITPNQLAAQIVIDSEIEHSSYYDYIYSLRNQYPIIQKEFINLDSNPELDIYRMIQYDIMFGNQWFYSGTIAEGK